MSNDSDIQQGDTPPTQEAPRRQLPLSSFIVIGVVVLVLSCCLALVISQVRTQERLQVSTDAFESSLAQATTFYGALDSGDYDVAHSTLGSPFSTQYSSEDLRARWEAFAGGERMSQSSGSVEAPTGLVEDARVHVVWTFVTSGGQTYNIDLTMQRQGDDWKIVAAEPSLIPER